MCLEEVKRNGESEVSTVNIHQYNQHKLARVTVKAFRSSQDDYELVKCRRLLQLVIRILPSVLRCFTHRHTQSGSTVCVICMWANTHSEDAPIQAQARQLYKHTERLTLSLTDDRWFHLVSEQSSDTAAEQNINPAQTHYICRVSNVLIHNTSVYHILCIHLLVEHFLEYVLLTDG